MTNKERQNSLDKQKWECGVALDRNMDGRMAWCEFCKGCSPFGGCGYDQDERESGCLCAKAYNRMVRSKQ